MDTPSAHGLLEAWERGQGRSSTARGLLLLHAALPDLAAAELAGLPLGRRNRLLLNLRIRLFGRMLDGLATCPACAETLETRLPLASPAQEDASAIPVSAGTGAEHEVTGNGWRVRYRLPTTADVMDLPAGDPNDGDPNDGDSNDGDPSHGDIEDSARWLLHRCIVSVDHDGRPAPASELPDHVAGLVADAMAELDPDAVVELVVGCPQCGTTSTVPLEPAAFLWAELDQWAWRVLAEVRDLASAYGWSEADILQLSPWRRQAYLELLPA